MKALLVVASYIGLALTLGPALFVFAGVMDWSTHAALMAAGMVLWFITAPFWMKKD